MIDVITENLDLIEGIIAVALTGLGIGLGVRILYLAGVISFKITNRGVGK